MQAVTITGDGSSYLGEWPGGLGSVFAEGDFNDGTLTLQAIRPGGTSKADVSTDTTFAAGESSGTNEAHVGNFQLPKGTQLYATHSGEGSGSTAITCETFPVIVSDR